MVDGLGPGRGEAGWVPRLLGESGRRETAVVPPHRWRILLRRSIIISAAPANKRRACDQVTTSL